MCYKVGAQPAFFIVRAGWPAPTGAGTATSPVGRRRPAARPDGSRKAGVVALEERIWEMCETYLAGVGLELDDLRLAGAGPRLVRVTIDREGGADVEQLASASRAISRLLDDMDPFHGPYSLEVTSPGLERSLRRRRHFEKSIGREVTVKTNVDVAGSRHHVGVLETAGTEAFVVRVGGATRSIEYGQVRSARTRFEWKKQPKSARKSG